MDQQQNPAIIPETIKKSFERSLAIRPCSYKPEMKIVEGFTPGTFRYSIPLEERLGHFLVYCEEKGKEGCIAVTKHEKEEFSLTNGAKGWFYPVQADVILDGKVISSDIAAQSCLLDNLGELDSLIQVASGIAKSRALAAAGFGGLVSGADFHANGVNFDPAAAVAQSWNNNTPCSQQLSSPVDVVQANGAGHILPSSQPRGNHGVGKQMAPVANIQTNYQESSSSSAAPSTPSQQTSFIAPPPLQCTGPIDPRKTDLRPESLTVEIARQIICTMNGPSVNGKTMEQIVKQDPSKIEYMAKRWKKAGADADLIRRAAELLLPDAMRKMGK